VIQKPLRPPRPAGGHRLVTDADAPARRPAPRPGHPPATCRAPTSASRAGGRLFATAIDASDTAHRTFPPAYARRGVACELPTTWRRCPALLKALGLRYALDFRRTRRQHFFLEANRRPVLFSRTGLASHHQASPRRWSRRRSRRAAARPPGGRLPVVAGHGARMMIATHASGRAALCGTSPGCRGPGESDTVIVLVIGAAGLDQASSAAGLALDPLRVGPVVRVVTGRAERPQRTYCWPETALRCSAGSPRALPLERRMPRPLRGVAAWPDMPRSHRRPDRRLFDAAPRQGGGVVVSAGSPAPVARPPGAARGSHAERVKTILL